MIKVDYCLNTIKSNRRGGGFYRQKEGVLHFFSKSKFSLSSNILKNVEQNEMLIPLGTGGYFYI
jgi:hypothetical protein